jgi:REP-associated tyrosine transposase
VPSRLKRYYGANHLHFITCSCYRRQALLGTGRRRDAFLRVLEEVRRKHGFTVVGYVVMPEHFHLLISESERGTPSTVMQVLKQRVAVRLLRKRKKKAAGQGALWKDTPPRHFWQKRFYDFNVWTRKKETEKLRYMHRNPVTRGLVSAPDLWRWGSFRYYAYREKGIVTVHAG